MLTFHTDKVTKEIKELKSNFAKAMMGESVFMSMDPTTLTMMQSCFRLLDTSADLMTEQAEMMELINRKLDRILDNQERA